jgi:hypothetical protein
MIALDRGPRFPLGRVVITHRASTVIPREDVMAALERFARGDWGDVDRHDAAQNEQDLQDGGRLLAAFHSSRGASFWIITEADRSVTSVILPEEY